MESPSGHKLSIRKDKERPNIIHVRFIYSDNTDINICDIEAFFAKKGFKSKKYSGDFHELS